jgi:hypothetical protein
MLQQQQQYYPNQFGGVPFMGTGVGYNQQQPAPVLNNFLTPEQMNEMQHGSSQFQTKLTRDEYMRNICTHKSNNRIMLEKQTDGQHHCAICGKAFTLFDPNTPEETIYGVCKNMHDLMQSIKTYFLNVPEDFKDIYMMLGFIEKIPLLWKTAVKTFEQASNQTAFGLQNNPQQDSFQMLGQIFGGAGMPFMGGGYYQQQPYAPVNAYGMTAPMTPPPAPVAQNQQAPLAPNQPPVYGYNPSYVMGQQPAPMAYGQQPVAQQNPIGYVEPNQGGVAQTQINISPTAPNQAMPLNQETVNPNLQPAEKVDVNKTFTQA